jgi:hypothetical protein
MMNYEIFKEVVAEKFMDFMPEQYQGYELIVKSMEKINRQVDGISILEPGVKTGVSPSVYINDMYEQYKNTGDVNLVLQSAADCMAEAMREAPLVVADLKMENASENIVFQLINTEQNRGMLADMPNRSFQDLSIIYRWVAKIDEHGIQSTRITNSLAKLLGFSEEQLFHLAAVNTRRIFPPVVKNMNDELRKLFEKNGMPAEKAEMMFRKIPPEQQMYVISNERRINGANSMLYEDKLHDLASELGTDLYILPSSIHEIIAVSTKMGEPNKLASVVTEINREELPLQERLSNQVYHYDKDLRNLTLATDTPNKRLDGLVTEQKMICTQKEHSR